ncbi:MAG: hypothetical protein R3C19_03740 [Planctomycetaceae bacterium]
METIRYRFRTLECSGTVELTESAVKFEMRHGGTRWVTETPYTAIALHPTTMTCIPRLCWIILFFGAAAILAGVFWIIDGSPDYPELMASIVLVTGGLGMLGVAIVYRREEWLLFPTELRDHRVLICRTRPDSDRFVPFVQELKDRVTAAGTVREL